MKHNASYWLYLFAGGFFLVLGAIGAFLPILPTTPFLLVSSFCFLRSSEKAHNWLMHHPVFGEYLQNYIEKKAIRRKDRRAVLFLLWSVLLLSAGAADIFHLRIFLLVVGFGVTIHLMLLRVIE